MELLQGQDELVCLVYDYSPAAINITWLLNDKTLHDKGDTSRSAKGPDGKFIIKSQLKLKASEWAPKDKLICRAEHITGPMTRSISKLGDFFLLVIGRVLRFILYHIQFW